MKNQIKKSALFLSMFILLLVCFLPGWGQYVGLNYSEENIHLINITKSELIKEFTISEKTITWILYYEDGSVDTAYIDTKKENFDKFWGELCTQPYSKLIIDGKVNEPINLIRHEIKILGEGKKSN